MAMASTLLLQSTMGFLRPSTALPATRVAAAAGLRLSQTRRSMAMISTETAGAADTEEFRVFFNVRFLFQGAWELWVGRAVRDGRGSLASRDDSSSKESVNKACNRISNCIIKCANAISNP